MSTKTDDQPDRRPDAELPVGEEHAADRAPLDHSLIGVHRRRTLIAGGFLVAFTALFVVSVLGGTITVDGAPIETQTALFDTVSSVLVLAGAVAITIAPIGYALWNGGPVTGATMPLVPIVLGAIASGRFVLGLDTVIALTVAAAAASIALYATAFHRCGSVRFWNQRPPADVPLLVVTGIAVVAVVAVARFLRTVPPHHIEWYAPFVPLWTVPAVVLGWYWYDRFSAGPIDRSIWSTDW